MVFGRGIFKTLYGEKMMRAPFLFPTPALAKIEYFFYQIFAIVLSGWLGGFSSDLIDDLPQTGRLLTIEEVGEILDGII